MGWRGIAAAALVLLASTAVPPAPAALPTCGASSPFLSAPTRAAQDDAGSGRDAPDSGPLALHPAMPAPLDGEQGAYYWAWLDPPVARDGADHEDWYAFDLAAEPKTLMLELVSNYTAADAMMGYGDFRATAYAPDGRVLHLSSAQGRVEASDAGGEWLVRVTLDPVTGLASCGAEDAEGGVPAEAYRNHGLYVGCRPVCLEDGAW